MRKSIATTTVLMVSGRRWRARHRRARPAAWLVAPTLMASTLVGMSVSASRQQAAAAVVPPGGIVASVARYGKTDGSFAVGPDGAARYTVPLWVPDGLGTVEPELSLSYDSGAGNGLIGVGWALGGLSSIAPCARTIAQDGATDGVRFDGSDALCLGGGRLLPVSDAQLPEREYRTEQESFARIVAYGMEDNLPNYFRVWRKDGKILTFGQTADSRRQAFRLKAGTANNTLVRESTTRVTLGWDLNRIEDRNGNAATIGYERVEGSAEQLWHVESRPNVIRYAPNREVRFSYEDRPDPIESYGRGVHIREPLRLSKVSMFGGPQGGAIALLREYRLGYQNASITRRSLLWSVFDCDRGGACKVPLNFNWSQGGYNFETINTGVTDAGQFHPLDGEAPEGQEVDNQIVVGDFNGDARDDILYPSTDEWLREGERQEWFVRLSTGAGFGAARPAGFSPPTYECANPNPPDGRIECSAAEGQVRTIDVDLDGRLEVLVWVPVTATSSRWRLYAFDGQRFVAHASKLEGPVETGNDPDPVYFADLDGNGTPDFITAPLEHSPADDGPGTPEIDGPWTYRMNTGQDGTARFAAPVNSRQRVPARPNAKVIDVNADGRADLIGSDSTRSGVGWGLDGAGTAQPRSYASSAASDSPREAVAADVNGDGLEDAVSPYTLLWRGPSQPPKGNLVAALSSGNGVGPYSATPDNYWEPRYCCSDEPPPPGGEPRLPTSFNRGVRYVDFNGDGADDVLVFRGGNPSSTDPTKFGAQLYIWRAGAFEWAPLNREAGDWGPRGFSSSNLLDVDGDGMLDILHVHGTQLRVLKRLGGMPDRLTGIGDPASRERIQIDYATLADRGVHTPGSCQYPLTCLTKGGSVVSQHRMWTFASSGGSPGWDAYDHRYIGARADALGRGSLGVASHAVTRVLTGATTLTEFDNQTRDAATRSYPYANLPRKVTATTPDNTSGRTLQSITETDYGLRRHSGGGYSVEPRKVTVTDQERAGSGSPQTLRHNVTDTVYDTYGNADLITSATTGGRTVVNDPVYRNETTDWLIGLPTRQSTNACTATGVCVTRLSTSDYDAKGNPTVSVTEPNRPGLKLTTTTSYDTFGNVLSVTRTDATGNSRQERFEYADADKLHPTATINALGHRTTIQTDSGLGLPLRTTDPNGVVVSMSYDGFGRLRATNRADGSFEVITHAVGNGTQTITTTASGGAQTSIQTDQLGRERERSTRTFAGPLAYVSTLYDPVGRIRQVSRPRLTTETARYTTTEYDNRDRPISVTDPDGVEVRHTYVNRETHTYDGRGVHSYTVANPDGDLESSYEDDPKSTSWLRTRFEWGPFGEATKSTAPDDTAQLMTYDTLGRRVRLDDPSTGATVTTYNAFGEVATESLGGRTTTVTHDALGRVTSTTSPDGTATNVWDTAAHGKGLLAKATSTSGVVTAHTYNPESKPETSTWTVEGTGYQIGYAYDEFGRQSQVTYPAIPGADGRLKVDYAYNPAGYLNQVKNPAGQIYWTAEARNSAGQLTKERLGTGGGSVVDTRAYNIVGLLTDVSVEGTVGGRMASIGYGYGADRNVIQRADRQNSRLETYGYDTLGRLQSWELRTPAVTQTTFDYDKAGNLRSEVSGASDRNATYTYGERGAPPHALTTRNGAQYTYDDAGRQVSGAGRTITYNESNVPKTLTWGQGSRTDFQYDASGVRVLKKEGDNAILTIGGLFERRVPEVGGTEVHNLHNIVADGRVVAQVNRVQATPSGPASDPTVVYLHTDLQGSTVLVTNSAGRPVDSEQSWLREIFYDPFGRRIKADGTPLGNQRRGGPHQGYTGHEHDDEFGLINMKGRIYDPEQRRFLTPDTIIEDPAASQALNRYTYVRNDPVTRVDPTGHCSLTFDMQSNSSYEELEGTNVSLAYSQLSDGRRMGRAIEERLASSDGLLRVGGSGGPDQLNAIPAAAAAADGDQSSKAAASGGSQQCASGCHKPRGENRPVIDPEKVAEFIEGMPAAAKERREAEAAARRAADARERAGEYRGSLGRLSAEELEKFIVDSAEYAKNDDDAALWAVLHDEAVRVQRAKKTQVIDFAGRRNTEFDATLLHQREINDADAAVLTGNAAAWVTKAVTGNTGLAALGGSLFDGFGKHAERINSVSAFHADPLLNPLSPTLLGPVPPNGNR